MGISIQLVERVAAFCMGKCNMGKCKRLSPIFLIFLFMGAGRIAFPESLARAQSATSTPSSSVQSNPAQSGPVPFRPSANPQTSSSSQAPPAPSAVSAAPQQTVPPPEPTAPAKVVSNRDRRRATKLFLQAAKLFEQSHFEAAVKLDEKAAALDPENPNYRLAAEIARSHAVTTWVQLAAKTRLQGDSVGAREALVRALKLDPNNSIATQHLNELADDSTIARGEPKPLYEDASSTLGPLIELAPTSEVRDFHEHSETRVLLTNVFSAYGLKVTLDNSLSSQNLHFDVDAVNFADAARLVGMITHSFYIPLDAHRVFIVRDTSDLRQQYMRTEQETIYLPGLNEKEIADVTKIVKEMFDLQQAVAEPTSGTMTVRAAPLTLDSLNTTLRVLLDGHSQVLLDVRLIELARSNGRKTGLALPQQLTVFNVGIAEQALLNDNQALVQQIIAAGLASANDPLAILGILLASGQVSSPLLTSLLNNGVGVFGGGASLTGVTPLSTHLDLNSNSADSRALDRIQLRLQDGEAGTIKSGVRYPITTSSFSSAITSAASSIPGLTAAGQSSALGGSLAGLLGSMNNTPMVEYQDIGLTLKATPNVMRSDNVVLTVDLKITSLAGPTVNGVPVLNNQAYSGVITLKEGEAVVVASQLNKQQSRALSGIPGLTEIPGLNNATGVDRTTDYASLIIVMTPHVIRGTQAGGHSPMLRIERKNR